MTVRWQSGMSVIIPHRGADILLLSCLKAAFAALSEIDEPYEIIIIVNGAQGGACKNPAAQNPHVRFKFFDSPLGFTTAIIKGLEMARYDWVYLLNNDMMVDSLAFKQILKCRSERLFAAASQIFFPEDRRREETGWTMLTFENGMPGVRHLLPEDDHALRGTAYAGAGSSLFHSGLLKEIIDDKAPFDPFYWEDVDWSVKALRKGYDVLFCPDSIALHKHRATVSQYYGSTKVSAVFERNRLNFRLHNPFPCKGFIPVLKTLLTLDKEPLGELSNLNNIRHMLQSRLKTWYSPRRDVNISGMHKRFYRFPAPNQLKRPAVLVVTPFKIFPPAHGGAIRSVNLIKQLSTKYNITLISDESSLYAAQDCLPYLDYLERLFFVSNRPEENKRIRSERIRRIYSHSHQDLKNEMLWFTQMYQPKAVIIEHMELGGIIDRNRPENTLFILSLDDVMLKMEDSVPEQADAFEKELIRRVDLVVTCCREDQNLLDEKPPSIVVCNGTDFEESPPYLPSIQNRDILFIGPFRCRPNLDGIKIFLRHVWPELSQILPDLTLTIVGGDGARQFIAQDSIFKQDRVRIIGYVPNTRPLLNSCAVTINPRTNMRGSSLKLIESISAGRICISTKDGARGFGEAGFQSLITVDRIDQFAEPLKRVLIDETYRLSIEKPNDHLIESFDWKHIWNPIHNVIESYRPPF
ncbi:MAG: glycosyltransferase [Pseudomonadota bacterium]